MAENGGAHPENPERDLTIRLFGTMEVENRHGVVRLPSRRAHWLLALLALRRGAPVERGTLAGMLWPDSTDAGALHNLRQTLAGLRRALGPAARLLATVSPRSVALDSGTALWVDSAAFDDAVRDGRIEALETATELFRGPLLPDCDEPFAIMEREARHRAFLVVAERLGNHYASHGERAKAVGIYRRAEEVDPYHEGAARGLMACLSRSGEAAAAMDVYRRLAQSLRRDLRSEPGPETKALAQSIRSALGKPRKLHEDETPKVCRLPTPLTALIGCEPEVEAIATLLNRCRLVTLTGVGGVGKTRLALAVAEATAQKLLEDSAFVDLAPVADPQQVPLAIASALGFPIRARGSVVEALSVWLRPQQRLIVMDNCERLANGVAEALEILLSSAPHLQVLATSRQPLGVAGESVWRTQPLATPKRGSTPEESLRSPSVRLFLERSARPIETEPGEEELETIGAICRQLDGIPLAIELAAARTNLLSVREIEERLGDRFATLDGGIRAVPRHRTLRTMMDWSWDLLTNAERDFLQVLSVFRGGATLEAIEAVSGLPALDLLSDLVDRSLVVASHAANGSRFTMLETVRQYASDRLGRTERREDVCARHGDFYSRWAERAADSFFAVDEASWFERLETDHDNLRAALEGYRSRRQNERELRLAVCLSRFWDTHGHLTEGRAQLEMALRTDAADLPSDLVADGHSHAGWMASLQRDFTAARDHYERALTLCRRTGDRRRVATALNCLAATNSYTGDYLEAQSLYDESLALYRELGATAGAASVLANKGETALRTNDPALARAYLEQSIAEAGGPEAGSRERRALTLNSLSVADFRQGRFEDARVHATRSLQLLLEARSLVSIPGAFGLLGVVEGRVGAWERAARLLGAEQGGAVSQGVPLDNLIDAEREWAQAGAIRALGADAFATASELGQRMALDEAVDFVLRS